jgi:hypothetical protein
MQPEMFSASPRRVALLLVSATLVLAAAGGLWFLQFTTQVRRDPGLVYREPATLEKLLKRANDAERAGDRATAITTYRFVITVGRGSGGVGGVGGVERADLAPYVVAARAGLTRLGVADTLPGPPR